jgi:hypothetical protein
LKVSYRNIAATACSKPVFLDGTSEHIGAKTGPVATNLPHCNCGAIQHKWEQLFKVKLLSTLDPEAPFLKLDYTL